MSAENNKRQIHRFYEELSRGNFDVVAELYAPDYLSHNYDAPEGERPGVEGVVEASKAFYSAFPDIKIVEEDLIAEGDLIVHRVHYRGTHRAEFRGIPATNREIEGHGVDVYRFAGGKVVEKWGVRDRLSMLQQLGLAPAM